MGVASMIRGSGPAGRALLNRATENARGRFQSSGRLPLGGLPVQAIRRATRREQNPQAGGLGEQFTQPMPRNTYGSGI